MTGWRIESDVLALRREDLDLKAGTALVRWEQSKGKRDDLTPLHPVVIEHLETIPSFEPMVFPWYHNRESLWIQFGRIQRAAGIHLTCREKHEHTERCHVYGFHDLRRAFATENAEHLSPTALQKLMRHRAFATTEKYINAAKQLKPAIERLVVPDVLAKRG